MKGLQIDETLLDTVIKGTLEGLEMAEVVPDAVGASRFNTSNKNLTVIVGLHGNNTNGNVALNMSKRTATFLASKMIGEELDELDEDAIDAVCEIGNMVAGRLKELLVETDYEFSAISLPALVFGSNFSLYHLKNIVTVSVTFEISEISVIHMDDKFFTTSISLLGQSWNPS